MTLDEIRAQFPVTRNAVYLDNAALTPLPQVVVDAVSAELEERRDLGVEAFWPWLERIEQARAMLAALLRIDADEIAFTQNTSEGLNIVANGIDWREGDNVVINDLEYFPNTYPWMNQQAKGVEVRIARHRGGRIDPADLGALMDARTRVLAVSHVAWVNGLRHDLGALAELCRKVGAFLCVDGIQSVGAIPVDLSDGAVDFFSAGGHKWLFAPTGTGFFYCRKDRVDAFRPPVVGWQSDDRPSGSQAYAFREEFSPGPTARRFNHGNSNVAGLHGLHASLALLGRVGWEQVFARGRELGEHLLERARTLGLSFNAPLESARRSTILNVAVSDPARTMTALKAAGIRASTRLGGIRVSPAFYNTTEEVDAFLEALTTA